ncbi:hypothetical protein VTN00DRAFT_1966 [Thermoascus crustaceus]|uniref:uncharacterized protein n=1 Tax=Thermoascus crustaceus TaxID=5088 RepID=UPI00374461B5
MIYPSRFAVCGVGIYGHVRINQNCSVQNLYVACLHRDDTWGQLYLVSSFDELFQPQTRCYSHINDLGRLNLRAWSKDYYCAKSHG